jgi:hypothetical protein
MDREWIGWLAGIIDGEGHISISPNGGSQHCIFLGITNTDKSIIDKVSEITGHGYIKRKRTREEWKDTYQWLITARQARFVLSSVLPYLVGKRERAELAIDLQTRIENHKGNRGRLGITEEEFNIREDYRNDMIFLNKKGA